MALSVLDTLLSQKKMDLETAIGLSLAAPEDENDEDEDEDEDDEDDEDGDDDDDDDDDGDDEDPDAFTRTSSEGTPLIAVPAHLAAEWTPEDTERAIDALDGKDVVKTGYVGTASVTVGKGRALVVDGELDTGFVPIEGGGVLVRGGSFDDREEAKEAVEKAIKQKKGWQAFPQTIAIGKGGLWVFDSAYPGGEAVDDFPGDFGIVVGKLEKGTYKVDIRGDEDDSGPIVFIRLTL